MGSKLFLERERERERGKHSFPYFDRGRPAGFLPPRILSGLRLSWPKIEDNKIGLKRGGAAERTQSQDAAVVVGLL